MSAHLEQLKTNPFVVSEAICFLHHGHEHSLRSGVATADWWHREMVLRVGPELCYNNKHCYFSYM